jgi:hypothetical protein
LIITSLIFKLNLNLAWRIGEEAYLKIVELIHQKVNVPNCLVEFGSGHQLIMKLRLQKGFTPDS